MSGAFRFWRRVLNHNNTNMFNTKTVPALAAAAGWVVWKRIDDQSGKKPVPCEQEYKDLQQLYSRVKSPENLNHFNRKTYMRLERSLRTCAEANPGFYVKIVEEDIPTQSSGKVEKGSKKEAVAKQPDPEPMSDKALEERLQRLERNTVIFGGKDVVVFLPKEERQLKSIARIPACDDINEERSMLLPNGEINWRCTCIEREIIGPCNIEFRKFREHVHTSPRPGDDMTDEELMAAKEVIGQYLDCCRENPRYYRDLFEDLEEDEDDEELFKEADEVYRKKLEEENQKNKAAV